MPKPKRKADCEVENVSKVEPPKTPRLYCIEATRWESDLGVAVVLVERDPDYALAEFHRLYPEWTRKGTRGRVFRANYAEIDFDSGRSFIIKRNYQMPRIVSLTDDERDSSRGGDSASGESE